MIFQLLSPIVKITECTTVTFIFSDFSIFRDLCHTSGNLRNDLLTPELRVKPWATPFPGPSGTESSVAISCRGFTTGIPKKKQTTVILFLEWLWAATLFWHSRITILTSCHQFGLILFITNFIIFHISTRKEKAHHSMEELVGELDGERHHIHLQGRGEEAVRLRYYPCLLLLTVFSFKLPFGPWFPKYCLFTNLKVFLNRDTPNRRPDFAKKAEGQLSPRLAGTLGPQNHLQHRVNNSIKCPLQKST